MFYVSSGGSVLSVTADDDDRTIPPQRRHEETDMDGGETIPPKRYAEYRPAADAPASRGNGQTSARFVPGVLVMGRYKVLAELGQGGMGVVYKCFDEIAGIEVALKALPPELSHNAVEMEDIRENFQLIAKLVHQNIAVSKNLERDGSSGDYYLIMECIEGEDLRRWIRRKRQEPGGLKLGEVLPVVRQVAAALDYAHEAGVIHRDIKPGNIMIAPDGAIKILDFGLAAQIHSSMTRISMAFGGTSGTGPYMAPEQWRGEPQGAAADQYALAAMTYEMLAGHPPFESPDPAVLQQAVLTQKAKKIPGLPRSARAALNRALSKDPSERFASCSDFAAALGGEKIHAEKKSLPSSEAVPKRGRKIFRLVAAALLLVALGAAVPFAVNWIGTLDIFGKKKDTPPVRKFMSGDDIPELYGIDELFEGLKKKLQRQVKDLPADESELGNHYFMGSKHFPQDYKKAVDIWNEKRPANYKLYVGFCYYFGGPGLKSNRKVAFEYFRNYKILTACCYYYGEGVDRNYREAVKCFEALLDGYDKEARKVAKYNLGCCHYRGRGVDKSYKNAVKLWEQCVEEDSESTDKVVLLAKYALGVCYYHGRGTKKDEGKAARYWSDAAKDYAPAKEALERYFR